VDRLLQTAGAAHEQQHIQRFCAVSPNFENPFGDTASALRDPLTPWCTPKRSASTPSLTEHHCQLPSASAPRSLRLLAHLAAKTSRFTRGWRGVAALSHPVRVAEDAATVDALVGGPVAAGFGQGWAFPDQFRHFGVTHDDSRSPPARSARPAGESVRWHWRFAPEHALPLRRPQRLSAPTLAAAGLAGPAWPMKAWRGGAARLRPDGAVGRTGAKMRALLDAFDALQPKSSPPFVLARYLLCRSQPSARARAGLPFIRVRQEHARRHQAHSRRTAAAAVRRACLRRMRKMPCCQRHRRRPLPPASNNASIAGKRWRPARGAAGSSRHPMTRSQPKFH